MVKKYSSQLRACGEGEEDAAEQWEARAESILDGRSRAISSPGRQSQPAEGARDKCPQTSQSAAGNGA